jgi:patatin-related protein
MELNTEVRLGLVMYGGVSLAVYINGVAQEFFQAVRRQGVYDLIANITESKITIDIISGTSAGGINGIFLAYALANNKNFADMADLWRELGDISQLLQDPKLGPENSKSLLDSTGFYHKALVDAFEKMKDLPMAEDLHIQEIDLFVTGTNIDGNISTTFDAMGHPIDVKDHRTIFQLKHRRGRKEPFKPENKDYYEKPDVAYQALSKLARITSCFPAAFQPVDVEDVDAPDSAAYRCADECLRYWGNIHKKAYFMDGGILDNKPFSYTIDAIFSRNANTDVERYLCYVEPDPESFIQKNSVEPTFIQATIKGGITITSYESIADDLASIREHNSRVQRYNRACQKLKGKVGKDSGVVPQNLTSQESSMVLYLQSRLNVIADRVVQGVLKDKGEAVCIEGGDRDRASRLVDSFKDWQGDGADTLELYDVYFRLRRLYHVVYRIKADLYDQKAYPEGYELDKDKQNLWQALNRQIEVLDTIRYWMEFVIDYLPIQWKSSGNEVRKPEEIWNDVSVAMRWVIDAAGITATLGNEYTAKELKEPHRLFDQAAITQLHRTLSLRWKKLEASPSAVFSGSFESLILWMDTFARKTFDAYGAAGKTFWPEYDQFLSLDIVVYPLEAIAGIYQKDILHTIRFSPVDAQKAFSHRSLEAKLSGDSFAHFGGFFKRSWRSNDILWGRLDGMCQLMELLFSSDRIRKIVEAPHRRTRIRRSMGIDGAGSPKLRKQIEAAFPAAGDESITRIVKWFERLFNDKESDREKALEAKEFDKHLNLLISMAQLDIIKSDVPNVVRDAITEESQWNSVRFARKADLKAAERIVAKSRAAAAHGNKKGSLDVAQELALVIGPNLDLVCEYYIQYEPGAAQRPEELRDMVRRAIISTLPVYDAHRGGFSSAGTRIDPMVMTFAAEHYASQGLRDLEEGRQSPEPAYTKAGQFFTTSYRVGSETIIDDIPKLVLLELFCRSLLVLKNCVLGSLPDRARKRVEGNSLFRALFDIPPRIVLAISRSLREDSSISIAVKSALTVLGLAAFLVGVNYWDKLIYPKATGFELKWFASLIIVPVIGLYVLWLGRVQRILGWALTGAGGLATLGLVASEVFGKDFVNDSLGFHMRGIALQLADNAARATHVIADSQKDLANALTFDSSIVIPTYLFAFSGFGIWIFMRLRTRLRWAGGVICGLAIGAASADFVENDRISALLKAVADKLGDGVIDQAARSVTQASSLKWAVLALMLLSVGVATAGLVWESRKKKGVSLWVAGLLTAACGLAAGSLGLWSVHTLSHWIEWSLVGLALCMALMGQTIIQATRERPLA